MPSDALIASRISRKGGGGVAVSKETRPTGRVVWHVTRPDGKRQTMATSRISEAAIRDAAAIYREALKRLAKR